MNKTGNNYFYQRLVKTACGVLWLDMNAYAKSFRSVAWLPWLFLTALLFFFSIYFYIFLMITWNKGVFFERCTKQSRLLRSTNDRLSSNVYRLRAKKRASFNTNKRWIEQFSIERFQQKTAMNFVALRKSSKKIKAKNSKKLKRRNQHRNESFQKIFPSKNIVLFVMFSIEIYAKYVAFFEIWIKSNIRMPRYQPKIYGYIFAILAPIKAFISVFRIVFKRDFKRV